MSGMRVNTHETPEVAKEHMRVNTHEIVKERNLCFSYIILI